MNVTNGNKTTSCQDETVCTLQIYPRLSVKPGQSCILRVPKEATAATVIKTALATLGLDTSKTYVLVEVQEYGGEEWVLHASDQPVQRVLLWPRKAQDKHPQSDGYFFALQEGSYDGSIQYDVMTSVRQEKVAQGLANRGFVTQQPQEYDDLCNLPELTEESILGTLRHRFHKQKIYTFASNILIAVNPFKFLPIYNPRYVKMYENHTLGKLEPHVFAIADAAFHTMLNKQVNQCIVISGESGSGKTQSTNFLIHCLTALSQKGYTSGVERTILGAGPVLEAFGNAKTAHNNNSSRFGKFIQVNYLESGVVRGAVVEKYLLEKCRLVSRGKTERNYHVFYYLLIGASEEEKDEFKLLHPEQYHYLKEDQAEMKHEFRRLDQAMEMVGFLPSTKKQIFSVLSAILYLGNVTYQPKDVGEGLKVGPDRVLYAISDLLKVKVELLVEALTTRKAMTANDTLILPYSLNEAITARDSMAKSLYSALFDWIVLRINHALLNKRDLEESVPRLSIGVLDIFGFEDFKMNSFEQFCINYANEQLQYYCNQRIFTLEQEEYRAEGITWHNIDYPDNIGCISLFSKKPTGLFYLLDEESNFPRATDSTLLEKFKQQHQDNPFFVQTPVREPAFVIQHFAGKVKYQIKDFREKNTDHMRPDIVALLRSSECSYLRQLIGANPVAVFRWGILRATIRTLAVFNEAGRSWAEKHPVFISFLNFSDLGLGSIRELHAKVLQSLKQFGGEVPQKLHLSTISMLLNVIVLFSVQNLIDSHSLKFIMNLTQHNRATRSLLHLHTKKKPPSISAQFQASLSKLLETLRKAEPFFVRCIRSNGDKREMHFDDALVLQQLRYTGMLQTVRIRRSGYGAKFTFKEFTDQFRVLLPKEISTPQQDITNLLTKMGLPRSSFQIGRTKVFLKESERQILQEALHKEVMRRIIILQRWFRACLMRKQYLREREGIITIQVLFRSWRYLRETYRCRAAIVIQTAWRISKERAEYLKQREKLKAPTPVVSKCFSCNDLPLLLSFISLFGPKASGSHSNFPHVKSSATFPGPRRNPTIKISRATRVQEKWNASLDREITDSNELRHLDEFLGNQVCVDLSETEKVFFLATTQFRDTIKSMYSISNPNIGYKTLMSGYQTRVSSLAGLKKASEVPLVVNLFQSVLDGFIRGELKRLEISTEAYQLGHLFSTYQVTIMQSCDQCSSFIWGMEKAFMCSSCKMVCHKKCLSKITVNCTGHCDRKVSTAQTLHFGVPVCALVRTADSVPFVMEKMLVHVEMNGLYTEGIYRKSGSVCRAKELHHLLEKSPQAVSFDNYPIHTITGLVKQWLRELPDPLMTYSLYNDFLYAADLPEESERLRAVYRRLDELPPPNFSTLERLIFHLVKVAKEEAHNRMSVNALAIVFAPCILRCPDSSDPLLSMKDINKTTLCVEILINEQTRRYNQKMEEIQQLENAEAMAVKQLKLRRQNTRPKLGSDVSSVDGANLEIEKNLLERIKSIKKEKNDLAFRLPEFDQDSSDAENMDSESLVSSDSLLEDHCVSLDSEASLSGNTALNSSKPEKPAKPHDPETGIKEPAEERNQNRSASRREGVQSMCVIQSQDGAESLGASVSAGHQGKRRFSDLDIPFIDEDV
uniref:Unconventional myosin-IXb-like n=1 Tax=Sinocyclocheilus grahami TaxID=75366 RepID=A0A672QPV4_SINGR